MSRQIRKNHSFTTLWTGADSQFSIPYSIFYLFYFTFGSNISNKSIVMVPPFNGTYSFNISSNKTVTISCVTSAGNNSTFTMIEMSGATLTQVAGLV